MDNNGARQFPIPCSLLALYAPNSQLDGPNLNIEVTAKTCERVLPVVVERQSCCTDAQTSGDEINNNNNIRGEEWNWALQMQSNEQSTVD